MPSAQSSTKTGIYLLQDGSEEPFNIRLHLAKDILTIQEQDVICVSGEPFYSSGGAEHKIPVVISKISKEQKAELSGLLFIGDGILQINGINVRSYRHEEVVQVLRNAGEEVTLTVSFLKRTPAFLKLPLCEDCSCIPSDQSSGTSSPLCDSGLHLNYHPNNTVKKINRNFPVNQQIIFMGWVDEKEQDSVQDRMYTPKFLALRGSSLFKFSAPPCKTYACIVDSHLMGLTIDFSMGFVCFDAATKAVLWRYKFSQLKGSSDDGKSKIKFLFQNPDTKLIEAKELEFSNLFAVLHCIHAFFAAKVACLDPMFVSSRNATMVSATSTLTAPSQISKLKYTS
ncbi:hypothetical protein cypCar_00025109 [Cyprinus carpio]|nr:hypothetical protein cypCar_00025109 [Cyprinus carpio]